MRAPESLAEPVDIGFPVMGEAGGTLEKVTKRLRVVNRLLTVRHVLDGWPFPLYIAVLGGSNDAAERTEERKIRRTDERKNQG